jgi:hypothetical protein
MVTNVLPSLSNVVTVLANGRLLRVASCGRVRGGSKQEMNQVTDH